MPAHSNEFPWPSYYGHFKFFEEKIKYHSAVKSLSGGEGGVYVVGRHIGDDLRVFVCDCYSFGYAEFIDTVTRLGGVDAIVVNSTWCGYTMDAKKAAYERRIGVFRLRDFMASLNKRDVWTYLDERDSELFEKNGWL